MSGIVDLHVWLPHADLVWVPALITENEGGVTTYELQDKSTVQISNHVTDPSKLDKVTPSSLSTNIDNLTNLDEFGEGAVIHQLRQRYTLDTIYTNIGTILVSINPYKTLPIYSPTLISEYQADYTNKPPHVFGIAAEAYKRLLEETQNQAVIISGESGAGKTEATKTVLMYLSEVAGSDTGVEQEILQSNPVLEAFGNSKTLRNNNSSRFGKWVRFNGTK